MNTLNHTHPIDQDIRNILIVEDDLDDQMLLRIAFEQTTENPSLHFACTAAEALDYLKQAPDHNLPLLILSDYCLPGLNGMKLIQRLNGEARYRRIEKVLLSNTFYFSEPCDCNDQSYQCLVKPYSYEGIKQLAQELTQLCYKKGL